MKNLNILATAFIIVVTTTGAFGQQITGSSSFSPTPGGARILSAQGETAANPAIGFQSSVSTVGTAENDGGGGLGIFRPIANAMAFATSSEERMRISSGGNISINTTTQNAQLEVNMTSTTFPKPAIRGNGTFNGIYGEATDQSGTLIQRSNSWGDFDGVGVFGRGRYVTGTGNGSMYGVVGSSYGANPLNNVGVFGEGKDATGYNVGVSGYSSSLVGIYNAGVIGHVELNTTATWNRAIFGLAPLAPNHFAGYFDGNVEVAQGTIKVNRITSDTDTGNHFRATDDDNVNDYAGIGNATNNSGYFIPTFRAKSDVTGWAGSGDVSNCYITIQADDNQTTTRKAAMTFDARNYSNTGPLVSKDLFAWGSYIVGSSTGSTYMSMDAQGKLGLGTTNPIEKLDIQNGNVRIGNVTTPTGYKLYVEKGILTEKVKVAVASSPAWADYVFASDYKLKPLSEVESFINLYKHLPNVPSADELVKEGLDLGKMQATQMEKIEELTLYMIEMKKEIEVLKKQNQALRSKN